MSVVLTEHLPLLATAPSGIQKLRGLILELAVRGKLVPQDSTDAPAREFLNRTDEDCARLVGERSHKNSTAIPPVPEDKQPFAIPSNWKWARLGNMVEVLDSLRKPVKKDDRKSGSFPYYGASGIVDYVSDFIFDEELVLVGEDGAKWGTGDLTAFSISGKTWVNNHAHVLRPNRSMLLDRYLVHALVARDLQPFITGTTVPKLNQAKLVSIEVPIPPRAEQHRIVAKVDELMALCDRLEAEQSDSEAAHAQLVEALLGTLTQSTDAADLASNWKRIAEHFDTLFTTEDSIDRLRKASLRLAVMGRLVQQDPDDEPATKLLMQIADVHHGSSSKNGKAHKARHPLIFEDGPYALPDGWVWTNIESISNVGTGATPSRTSPAYFNPPEIPWVTSGETREPFINVTAERVSPLALKETNLTVYPVGTLIVAMYGQGKTRGQISELMIEAATNQACAAIVPAVSDMAMRKYTKLYFLKIYDEIREEAAGGAQPNLNIGKIKSTLISLPPLAEQHRIAAKVDELMTLCDRMKADLREARGQQSRLAETLIDVALEIA